tara:strand:- start:62 stop:1033 length:972 start_codon:yes stop_codon:yes gene_type:complete
MNILVTGAGGFIGSHLVELLLHKRHKVIALTHYKSENYNSWLSSINNKNLKIVSGNVKDQDFCNRISKKVDIIFNLAAIISIPYSYISIENTFDTNVWGAMNICLAAQKNKVKKVIQMSTSEVYGTAEYTPIDELHPKKPQSPYSASKIAADALVQSFYHSFDLDVVIARPFNTYGPRQSQRAIIPTIISQLVSGKKYIKLGNINTHRDFTFVEDTCSALYCLMMAKKTKGEIFNIGSQNVYSIKETLDIIQKKLNTSCKIILDKKRIRPENSEVFLLSADYKKLKKLTKYKPKYNFKKGIEKTINWFLKNENFIKSANKYHI